MTPCGVAARKQLKRNIRCGDGVELPYGYVSKKLKTAALVDPRPAALPPVVLVDPPAPKKAPRKSKKALSGYGEFADSPKDEAKLARFIDQHLTVVGPRELLLKAQQHAKSDHHILAALYAVKDEAQSLYQEALKIVDTTPCAKAKIGKALQDLNVMIKTMEK